MTIEQNLTRMADAFERIASALETLAGKPVVAAAPDAPKPEEPKPVTVEDVRAAAQKVLAAGKGGEWKNVLASFKAEKISQVPADKLGELLAKVSAIKLD